jgi:4-amino-4-deoxy-L-arabinose transferase-like glycosyltransferase
MMAPMEAPATRIAFARRLAAIAAAGLAARLVYVLVVTPDLRGYGDASFYHELGNLLADGHGFVEPGSGVPTALHPPLFPLLLAAASKLGVDSYQAQRVVVCLVGAATVLAAGLVARRAAGDRAGLLAAALAAIAPVLISADGAVMSETLLGLLVALATLAAYALVERPSLPRAALLGALVGAAALTRGEAILLLVLLVLPVALRLPRARLATLATAAVACLVVLAPWTIRNLSTFDRPVPISTNEGNLIAGANCPSTYYGRDTGSWDIRCVPRGRAGEDESRAAARYRRAGLDYAGDHAGRIPVVLLARLGRTFELYQPVRQARHGVGRATRMEIAGGIGFLLLVPLAVYGALALRRRRGPLAPLLAPVGLALAATLVGYGVPRFRHPADVAVVILAGIAIDALLRRRAAQRPAGGATGAGSAVASPRSAATGERTSRLSRSAGRSIA